MIETAPSKSLAEQTNKKAMRLLIGGPNHGFGESVRGQQDG